MLSVHYLFAVLSIIALITFKPLAILTIGCWFIYLLYVCYHILKEIPDDGSSM